MKDKLAENIVKLLQEIKHDKFIVDKVKIGMLNLYGILRGQTQKMFSGDTPIEKLDKNTLIRFAWELNKATHNGNVDPYNYFTVKEVDTAKKVESDKEDIEKFPIIIHNAIQVDENTYIAFMDAKNVVKLYNSNLLEYNYNINKRYKLIRDKMGVTKQIIDINVKEVKEIAEKIRTSKYAVDKIILNVMVGSSTEKTHNEEITYYKDSRKLLIHQSQVDIVDGLHDIGALMHVFDTNPDIELKVEVEIKHLDLQNIKNYYNKLNIKGGVN